MATKKSSAKLSLCHIIVHNLHCRAHNGPCELFPHKCSFIRHFMTKALNVWYQCNSHHQTQHIQKFNASDHKIKRYGQSRFWTEICCFPEPISGQMGGRCNPCVGYSPRISYKSQGITCAYIQHVCTEDIEEL